MTGPTGPDQTPSQGGAPQGRPGWGADPQPGFPGPGYGPPPGYGSPPEHGQTSGYGPPAGYAPAPPYAGPTVEPPSMGMPEAVRSVLTQYATFSGRARRSEFWWFFLFNVIVSFVAALVDTAIDSLVLEAIVSLALLIPGLAVGARRLHDIDRTGWWQLIALIPLVGVIVLIVFWCQDGDRGPNKYGHPPKYPAPAAY